MLSRKFMQSEYEKSFNYLNNIIKSQENLTIGITFDYWSNMGLKSFLGISLHFIDQNFVR